MGGSGRRISEFEASLVYRVSSRTARATQRNPVLKKQTNKQKRKERKKKKKKKKTCKTKIMKFKEEHNMQNSRTSSLPAFAPSVNGSIPTAVDKY